MYKLMKGLPCFETSARPTMLPPSRPRVEEPLIYLFLLVVINAGHVSDKLNYPNTIFHPHPQGIFLQELENRCSIISVKITINSAYFRR